VQPWNRRPVPGPAPWRAYGRPSWKFHNCGNVTLINPANEGRAFNPALFEFRGCRDVLVLNPQFAGAELPIDAATERYPDGMLFQDCENCRVIGGAVGPTTLTTGDSYNDKGDKTAKLIRVRASRYITGSHVPTLLCPDPAKDVEIECSTDCCFELWGQHKDVRRLVEVGCPSRDQLIWSPPLGFVAPGLPRERRRRGSAHWRTHAEPEVELRQRQPPHRRRSDRCVVRPLLGPC
jgi:hypothetical protein